MSESNGTIVKSRGMQFIDSVLTPDRMEIISAASAGNRYATPDKIKGTIIEACMRNQDLFQCDPTSVYTSCMLAARLDLDASGFHNGAAFVARWAGRDRPKECGIQFGYGALVDLATRDGRIRSFSVGAVYAGDKFEYELGTHRFIRHTPGPREADDKPTHFYAIAWYPDGGYEFEVMLASEVDEIRDKHATHNGRTSPAWQYSYPEQGKKTVLRRLIKRLPVNPVLAEAIHEGDISDGYRFDRTPKPTPTLETKLGNDETTDEPEMELIDEEPERDPDTNEIIPDEVGRTDLFEGEGQDGRML